MEQLSIDIGNRIVELRKQKYLSQEKLAYMAEIDRTYMTGIERGKRKISVFILDKIVKALDTNLSDFFNDKRFVDGR